VGSDEIKASLEFVRIVGEAINMIAIPLRKVCTHLVHGLWTVIAVPRITIHEDWLPKPVAPRPPVEMVQDLESQAVRPPSVVLVVHLVHHPQVADLSPDQIVEDGLDLIHAPGGHGSNVVEILAGMNVGWRPLERVVHDLAHQLRARRVTAIGSSKGNHLSVLTLQPRITRRPSMFKGSPKGRNISF